MEAPEAGMDGNTHNNESRLLRMPMRRPLIILLAVFVVGIPLGLGVHAVIGQSGEKAASCPVETAAFLHSADTVGFSIIGDSSYDELPSLGLPIQENTGPLHGRQIAWLNDIALRSDFRAEPDAAARSLGYTVGPVPLLPLAGRVVASNPGVLEVYETVWSFARVDDAKTFFAWLSVGRSHPGDVDDGSFDLSIGDDSYAYRYYEGPADGQHEVAVAVEVRLGSTVVQLALRGGAELSQSVAVTWIGRAMDRLTASCMADSQGGASR